MMTKKISYKTIKENPNITMSQLERKIGTNPSSLKEHCELLEYFELIEIKKEKNTRRLKVR